MNPNQQQAIEYGASSTRLYFAPELDGRMVRPDSAPSYALSTPSGGAMASGTMTAEPAAREFTFLDYDAQAPGANFKVGDLVTGGTSGAIGVVVGDTQDGATGRLHLSNVDGDYQDDEAITGAKGGAASVNGAPYSPWYYVDIDASSTASWPIDRNYSLKADFDVDGRTITRYRLFDVALYPMISPSVTTEEIDSLHPRWAQKRPKRWADWTVAIREGHRQLVEKINAHGENAADYVKRDYEFHGILLAHVEAVVAREIKDDADEYRKLADAKWTSRGVMSVSDDEDIEPERVDKFVSVKRIR